MRRDEAAESPVRSWANCTVASRALDPGVVSGIVIRFQQLLQASSDRLKRQQILLLSVLEALL